jgi:Alginate export
MRSRAWTTIAAGCVSVLIASSSAGAQTAAAQPDAPGALTVSGSVRGRIYAWHWFGETSGGDYAYPAALLRVAVAQPRPTFEWRVEAAVPLIGGLPHDAVLPAPRGQLGLGGSYFAANDNAVNAAGIFPKQAFFRWNRLAGVSNQSLTIGRIEFDEGSEVVPASTTLAALKRDRISQRLLGGFGFSDVGRSIDGALYSRTASQLTITALAGRPTRGVFDVNGWPELNIALFYGALTRQIGSDRNPGEWRAFALGYDDYRSAVKTDNRPLAMRAGDTKSVSVGTYGGHYLQIAATPAGPVDLLAWGAVQTGSWGALAQRAGAFALEAGWRPAALAPYGVWLRAGHDVGSGDHDPGDHRHGTFFQVLPTPRPYARLPFFNMMNTRDSFVEAIARPLGRLMVRSDLHALRLAQATDLWYSGGGAFEPETFGYTGRPSSGQTALAGLWDISGDCILSRHVAATIYYGHGSSRAVPDTIYGGGNLQFAYLEITLRF